VPVLLVLFAFFWTIARVTNSRPERPKIIPPTKNHLDRKMPFHSFQRAKWDDRGITLNGPKEDVVGHEDEPANASAISG
jgi:hypothetical protein